LSWFPVLLLFAKLYILLWNLIDILILFKLCGFIMTEASSSISYGLHKRGSHCTGLSSFADVQAASSLEEIFRAEIAQFLHPLRQRSISQRMQQAYRDAHDACQSLLLTWEQRRDVSRPALQSLAADCQIVRLQSEVKTLRPKFLATCNSLFFKAAAVAIVKRMSKEDEGRSISARGAGMLQEEVAAEAPSGLAEMEILGDLPQHSSCLLLSSLRSGDVLINDDEKDMPPRLILDRISSVACRSFENCWDEGCGEIVPSCLGCGLHLVSGQFYHAGVFFNHCQEGAVSLHLSEVNRMYEDDEVSPDTLIHGRFIRLDFARLLTEEGIMAVIHKTGVTRQQVPVVMRSLYGAIVDRIHEQHQQAFIRMHLSLARAFWAHLPHWPWRHSFLPSSSSPSQTTFCSEHVAWVMKQGFERLEAILLEDGSGGPFLVSPLASYDPKNVTPSLLYAILRPYSIEIFPS
jgi:hypothetical protein